jgi:yecA family protein
MAYQTINNIFQKNETDLSAAEAHGLATGLLCIDNKTEIASWLAQLLPDEIVLIDEDKSVLIALFEQTRKLMNEEDEGFRYDLFLPGDDVPLNNQLEALRSWCEGFLFGVGFSRSSSDWPGETGEIMKDIVEFTKLDSEVDDQSDEDESALIEIQEYIRVAVMMVRDLFNEESNGNKH